VEDFSGEKHGGKGSRLGFAKMIERGWILERCVVKKRCRLEVTVKGGDIRECVVLTI
jgi:hypothetical protein